MNNTQKKKVQFTVCPAAPHASAGNSVLVKNMRPDVARGSLVPVGAYRQSATVKGVPLLVMDIPGGTRLFSYDNGHIWVSDGVRSLPVADVDVCPSAAVAENDTAMFMLPDRAPLRLKLVKDNGGLTQWRNVSVTGMLPAVNFVCAERHTLSAATEQTSLEGDYAHWTGPLSAADREKLTGALVSAYGSIVDKAAARGLFVQPVMLWWRLLDEDGRMVHRSVPILLSASGLQGTGRVEATVTMQGGSFRNLKPLLLKTEAFLPAVNISKPSPFAGTVEVMITPPLETVALNGGGEVSYMFNGSTAVEASMLLSLPHRMDARRLVENVLDRLESISQVAVRLPASAVTDTPVPLPLVGYMGAKAMQNALMKAVAGSIPKVSALVEECSVPHSFSAGAAASVGDMALWGNVTPVHCMPPGVGQLATKTDSVSAWAGAVRAGMAGGEVLAETESALSDAPVELSALIAYPLAACGEIKLQLSSEHTAGRRSRTFALSPTPGGMWAMYVSDGLKPVLPAEWELSETAIQAVCTRAVRTYPDTVLAAPVNNPLAVECHIHTGGGTVQAITPASRTQSAWDFARRHLYVFATGGIYSLAVNSARTLCSAHLIHPVGVADAAKVAATPQGVYAALTSGQLVCVAGSAAKEVKRNVACRALGWSSAHGGEVWCALDSGGVLLICPGDKAVELTDIDIRYMAGGSGGQLWLVGDDGGLYDAGVAVTNGFTSVSWRQTVCLPAFAETGMCLAHVDCDCTSSMTTGRFVIYGHNGNPVRRRVLAGFRLGGGVAAPLRCRVPLCAPFRYIVAEFTADVTNDTRIGTITLTFTKQ